MLTLKGVLEPKFRRVIGHNLSLTGTFDVLCHQNTEASPTLFR